MLAAGTLFVLVLATAADGQRPLTGEELDAETRAVASQLRCPVCQGESIQDSPADLAVEMRGVVREQLAAGRSPDEVKAYFVERYGEWILLAPPARGFNLVLYILPFAGLAAGALLVTLLARRWQARTGSVAVITDDEY